MDPESRQPKFKSQTHHLQIKHGHFMNLSDPQSAHLQRVQLALLSRIFLGTQDNGGGGLTVGPLTDVGQQINNETRKCIA